MATVWEKSIKNPTTTPWLDWIETGVKKYEGRINRDQWTQMKVNDIIVFTAKNKTLSVVITDFKYYADFAQAFDDLGSEMVPIQNADRNSVTAIYSKFYKDADIAKHGVVMVGVKPIVD